MNQVEDIPNQQSSITKAKSATFKKEFIVVRDPDLDPQNQNIKNVQGIYTLYLLSSFLSLSYHVNCEI